MKHYFILLILISHLYVAQVAIGKTSISSVSSIMEFDGQIDSNSPSDNNTDNFRGILLPATSSTPIFAVTSPSTNHAQNGTFLYDRQLQKIRMFENIQWVDLSDTGSSSELISTVGSESGNGVIIGAQSSAAQGSLVFESTNKALVLPHIKNPHTTVKNPYPGMICYDTVSNSMAVFDGVNWSFWK